MRLDQNGIYVPIGSPVPIPSTTDVTRPISLTLTDPGPFQDGYAYTYAVRVTDAQNDVYDPNGDPNSNDLAPPHTTTIVIDSSIPTPGLIQLDPISDSGLNIGTNGSVVTLNVYDNITNPNLLSPPNKGQLVFDVQIAGKDRGSSLYLVRKNPDGSFTVVNPNTPVIANAVPNVTTGRVSAQLVDSSLFGTSGLADGTYTYFIKIVDTAGNAYDPATDLNPADLLPPFSTSVVVDTTPPPQAGISLDPASDSGTQGDNITDPTLTNPRGKLLFNVQIAAADRYSLVTLTRNGTQIGVPTYASATPVNGFITIQFTDPGPFNNGTINPDGTIAYNYVVTTEDRAGNVTVNDPLKITINTPSPFQGTLTLDLSSDTGLSNSDDITNPALVTPPSVTGTLRFDVLLDQNNPGRATNDVGLTAYLLRSTDGGQSYTRVSAAGTTVLDPATSLPIVYLVDSSTFTDRSYLYQVEIINTDGTLALVNDIANTTVPVQLTVSIDSTPPLQPSTPTLDRNNPTGGSDSGVVGDNITNVSRPYLTGTAEAGDLVQIVDSSGTVYGQSTVNNLGIYDIQAGTRLPGGTYTNLSDGTYAFSIISTDIAGNRSPRSGSLTVTINTQAITPTPTLKLISSDDTGSSNSDSITNVQQPHFQGTGQVGLNVQLLDLDGTIPGDLSAPGIATGGIITNPDGSIPFVLVQPDGTFQVQIKRTLPGGVYHLAARTYEPKSGNYADSPTLTLTILVLGQNSNLTAPQNFGLNPADDTGTKGDDVTSTRLYRLIGKADPNTLVELFQVGSNLPLDTITSDGQGNFTLRPPAQFVNGSISYYAREVDIAGNLGPVTPSGNTGLTIRTITVPGDFNNDGKADAMTYNRSTGVFNQTITGSNTTSSVGPIVYQGKTLNGPNFIPIEGDYNGDGKEDFGVYDFSTATFYIEESTSNGPTLVVKPYGWAGHDLPLVADFNGDGTTDIAVFRPSTATFYSQLSNGRGSPVPVRRGRRPAHRRRLQRRRRHRYRRLPPLHRSVVHPVRHRRRQQPGPGPRPDQHPVRLARPRPARPRRLRRRRQDRHRRLPPRRLGRGPDPGQVLRAVVGHQPDLDPPGRNLRSGNRQRHPGGPRLQRRWQGRRRRLPALDVPVEHPLLGANTPTSSTLGTAGGLPLERLSIPTACRPPSHPPTRPRPSPATSTAMARPTP